MEAIQESLHQMMVLFSQRMDNFEKRQNMQSGTPSTESENLSQEFIAFKNFAIASLRGLQGQIEVIAKQVDQQEMRGRRKILLLHGIKEEKAEDINKIVTKVMLDHFKLSGFSTKDISISHRMGSVRTATTDKPRPILFKLREESVRAKIWSTKVSLKGTGITLSEFLTKTRHEAFLAARTQFGITNCWTRDGIVFVISPNGTRFRITCIGDLNQISTEIASKTTAAASTSEPTATMNKPRPKRPAAIKRTK